MRKLLLAVCLILLSHCSRTHTAPPLQPGALFPSVTGESLAGKKVTVPDDLKGEMSVLLVGYIQRAQFDIDRWILGLLQAEVPVKILELPTIPGLAPRMIQNFIDSGMRSGIPREDWGIVVTIYDDAHKIVEVLGNENPQNAYVVLLGQNGEIVWTTNRGYSASQVLELKRKVLNRLGNETAP